MGMRKLSEQTVGGTAGGGTHKLDDHLAPDDNTDTDVSTGAHGLTPKLSNVVTQFLNGTGAWTVPAGGGGGTPGGADTELQYNDSGAFNGAALTVVDPDEILRVLHGVGDNSHHVQRALWQGPYFRVVLNWTSAPVTEGIAKGSQGTETNNVAMATTNIITSTPTTKRRPGTAASVSWLFSSQKGFWRGDSSGLGGFSFAARVGYLSTENEDSRRFIGMTGTHLGSISTFGVTFLHMAGFSHEDTGESNWFFRHNDGSGSPTAVDTGLAHAADKFYDMRIFCAPNGSTIYWWIQELNGSSASGSITTDLPDADEFLYAAAWIYKVSASNFSSLNIAGLHCQGGI